MILSGQAATGRFTAAVSDSAALMLAYLAVAVICAAVAVYATRIPREGS
jgi:hypothetical protein